MFLQFLILIVAAEVPYIVSVKSLSLAGCGDNQQVYCFTVEGGMYDKYSIGGLYYSVHVVSLFVVPPPPVNVRATQLNATTIGVSWTKYTLVELKGLANYVITYNIVIASRRRGLGETITVPWRDNQVFITNLHSGAQYIISVGTSTSAGVSGCCGVDTRNK